MISLSSEQAREIAAEHARRIVLDIDDRLDRLTEDEERKAVEAVEHDLRESLENLRIEEGGGE